MKLPVLWCIGGMDSSSGAGLARDTITASQLHTLPCTLTTLVSAQSHHALFAVQPTCCELLNDQFNALLADNAPDAIKIGAVANDEQLALIASQLTRLKEHSPALPVIWDPVLKTSAGGVLSGLSARAIADIAPFVTVVTPNINELSELTALAVENGEDAFAAARELLELGFDYVLIKGGHADWQKDATDTLVSLTEHYHYTTARYKEAHVRGTGCTLATALAAFMAEGYQAPDAVCLAKGCVSKALSACYHTRGALVPGICRRPENISDFPQVSIGDERPYKDDSANATAAEYRPRFLPLIHNSATIYPVVDSVHWLRKLLPTGVRLIQLRIKNVSATVEGEVKEAVGLAKQFDCQLFINDHWELAIKHRAFGVHLGQEDLQNADLPAIAEAGLRLGVSTHGFAELCRVIPLAPSYIALGHIFPTRTKKMASLPQGIHRLARYVSLCKNIPTVAIGGISPARLQDVKNTGVTHAAMVTAITESADPVAQTYALQEAWRGTE
ncbi:thiamine phosphate synthase [Alteromonas pelagimontana]|uniref:Thiamine phosphate synthase n=1 Tax=Alteromonas pelagimontana TaxID=1858656 RepID=A0A6M4MDD4_9ALTE|nr:thiamine phosphate synthase [Alteromonas pelagimontana]QJR81132.1 thiamine phosphate synthase [Alteromonas pelagimontana]